MQHHANQPDLAAFSAAISTLLTAENILSEDIERFSYGTDASFYRLVPKLVLRISNEPQLIAVMQTAIKFQVALTFRAAGTSLSGQAITDSVLIILSDDWQQIDICPNTGQITLQPNVIGAQANRALAPYLRKIGPDPASINSCKIGGIAANNASGMCCGVKHNSYHTMANIRLIFADGTVLDTSDPGSRAQYLQGHQDKLERLTQLSQQIKQDPQLLLKVQSKYRLKNTTGYGINALIDFVDPIDILAHLMIGSEGTLAFISNITYQTIPIQAFKLTGLFLFSDISIASQLVTDIANEKVDAVEIMDVRALRSVSHALHTILPELTQLPRKAAGLLIEISANSQGALSALQQQIITKLKKFAAYQLPSKAFTDDETQITQLWNIRKGMFPAVGANRVAGTTVIIEDICFPIDRLSQGIADLHQLFEQYHYDEAIIFGHALMGNLHFVFTQCFDNEQEVGRYRDFMAAVSHLVVDKYQGSLKAEHGTGRNMAPFVELEWGHDLYRIMQQIKAIFDPHGVLNPGVIINEDANVHLKNFKAMPAADAQIDDCIECGFCEPVCPSEQLTLTPRQRIAVWRRITELKSKPLTVTEQQQLTNLTQQYQYYGIDSCAATGLCAQACPVAINTGDFIKSLRQKQAKNSPLARWVANHFAESAWLAKFALTSTNTTANLLGNQLTKASFSALNKVSLGLLPKWYSTWPKGGKKFHPDPLLKHKKMTTKVVYIPACGNRIFATDAKASDQRSLMEVMASILNKANIEMLIPAKVEQLCCGMPWQSKGLTELAKLKQQEYLDAIYQFSEQGKWPIVTDASPCALTVQDNQRIEIYEACEFMVKFVVDKLTIKATETPYMLHKTCSSQKMDGAHYLQSLAHLCSKNIIIPTAIHCCGFAGDKGFNLPELNDHALRKLKQQVPNGCSQGVSNSRTCEIGLAKNAEIPYQSLLYLLDKVSDKRSG